MKKTKGISKITLIHYLRFLVRTIFFILAIIFYFVDYDKKQALSGLAYHKNFLYLLFGYIVVEMILRAIPLKEHSMGILKVYKSHYIPSNKDVTPIINNKGAIISAICWIALSSVITVLYFMNIIDQGILILISLFYTVCDMICVCIFCPFQTIIMKNKCCTTCRIYNWDFIFIATPLILIPNILTYIVFIMALIILIKWEYTCYKYPQRFYEGTNMSLKCKNCKEKLCNNKPQLRYLLKTLVKNGKLLK